MLSNDHDLFIKEVQECITTEVKAILIRATTVPCGFKPWSAMAALYYSVSRLLQVSCEFDCSIPCSARGRFTKSRRVFCCFGLAVPCMSSDISCSQGKYCYWNRGVSAYSQVASSSGSPYGALTVQAASVSIRRTGGFCNPFWSRWKLCVLGLRWAS